MAIKNRFIMVGCCGENPIIDKREESKNGFFVEYHCEICGSKGRFGMPRPRTSDIAINIKY